MGDRKGHSIKGREEVQSLSLQPSAPKNKNPLKMEAKMKLKKSLLKIHSLPIALLFLVVLLTFPTNTHGEKLVINLKVGKKPIVVKIISFAPEKIKDAVIEVVKAAVSMYKDEDYIETRLVEKGIGAEVSIDGNTYIIDETLYPELEQVVGKSGRGAIASEKNASAKKVKLSKKQFNELWNQIMEANKKIEVKEANGVLVNGVEGFVLNMDKVLDLSKKMRFIKKGEEIPIGNSQWAVNVSNFDLIMLRKIKGVYYFVPPHKSFLASDWDYDDALRDGKLNVYVFNKHIEDFGGYNLDFAVLRLRDANKYALEDISERFDLYMKSFRGSLHIYVEVPKEYEVEGVMPEIKKMKDRLSNGETLTMYGRGFYLALRDKNSKEEAIFFVVVIESKYGIHVGYVFGKPKDESSNKKSEAKKVNSDSE